jgi:hypothetical protein
MRARVERERGRERDGRVAYKTGAGGLMDVDFLASGGRLERGAESQMVVPLPSNPALLASVASGPRVDGVLRAYETLRRVEARARFAAGRAVEELDPASEAFPHAVAMLAPKGGREELLDTVGAARREIRAGFRAVVEAGSIGALEG